MPTTENVNTNTGAVGATLAPVAVNRGADSRDYQYVHPAWGADGATPTPVNNTAGNGLPIQAIAGALADIGTQADTSTATTVIGRLQKLVSLLPAALVSGRLDVNIGATGVTQPVSGTVTANAGSGTFAVSHANASQADGHSATLGTTTDASSANTVIGLLKKLVSLLPSALVSGRLDVNIGADATQVADKSGFTEGTSKGLPAFAVFNDTISADPTEDQAAALRITAKRGLHVNLRNVSGTEIGTASNPVRTDPTGSTTQPVSGTVTGNQGTAAAGSGAWPMTVTNTADTVVKPGDSTNNAIRVNIVAGGSTGGTAQADKSSFTEGTTNATPIAGVFNETISADPTEDQAAAVRITAKRSLHVTLRDGNGVNAMDNVNNAVRVNIVAGAGGGTSSADGAAYTGGTTTGTPMMGARDDTATGTLAEDKVGILRMTTNRALHVNLRDNSGNEFNGVTPGDATAGVYGIPTWTQLAGYNGTNWDRLRSTTANGLQVDVTRVQGTVTVDSELPAAAALADGASNPTAPAVGAFNMGWNGTGWDRLKSTTANGLQVDVTRVQGTVTVDSELPAAAALADATSNPTVPGVGSFSMMYNGTTWDRMRGTTANGITVDVTRIQAGSNLIGRVNIEPQTANGLTISRTLSAASTNSTNVKASAGQVYGWYLYNANAAVRYLKLYNKATAPTVGTDTPVMTIPIPPGAGANVEYSMGIPFGTGIGIAITTGVADNDTGAVAANEIIVNLLYK